MLVDCPLGTFAQCPKRLWNAHCIHPFHPGGLGLNLAVIGWETGPPVCHRANFLFHFTASVSFLYFPSCMSCSMFPSVSWVYVMYSCLSFVECLFTQFVNLPLCLVPHRFSVLFCFHCLLYFFEYLAYSLQHLYLSHNLYNWTFWTELIFIYILLLTADYNINIANKYLNVHLNHLNVLCYVW